MIVELCNVVRQFLYDRNVQPQSFHQGMLEEKAREESENRVRERVTVGKRSRGIAEIEACE